LSELLGPQLGLLWLVTIGAAVLRSFTGFGFALAAVPVYALFMSPSHAVVLSASLILALSLRGLPQYWGKTPIKPLVPMVAMSVVGTVIGALLLAGLDQRSFLLFAGPLIIAVCVVLSVYHPQRLAQRWSQDKGPGLVTVGGTGLLSGLLNGGFAIPGPPVIIYAMATLKTPEASRSLMMTFFLFSSAVALTTFLVTGMADIKSLWLFLLGLPAILLGDKLGYALFLRFGGKFYRRVAIVALFMIGVSITLKSL
jgi:uncharacterized membrane protein YfcA